MTYSRFPFSHVIPMLGAFSVLAGCTTEDDCLHISGDLRGEEVSRCAARVEHIEGSLFMDEASGELKFPKLVEVGGDIAVYDDGPTTVAFPSLERVEGALTFANGNLESVDFPALVQAGELNISFTRALRSLSLPALRELGSGIDVVDASLSELSLPALERAATGAFGTADVRVERIDISEPATLRRILMPKLKEAETVLVQGNEALTEIDFSSLTDVSLSFELVGSLSSMPDSLEILDLPKLASVGSFEVELTESLQSVSLPALQQAGLLRFTANAVLTQVIVPSSAEVSEVQATRNPAWCSRAELLKMLDLTCPECDAEPAACAGEPVAESTP